MITVSSDIKGLIAVIALVVLWEIIKWGIIGIFKDIGKLKAIRAEKLDACVKQQRKVK